MNIPEILLAEDNPDDIELTLYAFKAAKFMNNVTVVQDGQEALDYLFAGGSYSARDVADVPALVLLDLNMPKVGGLEVLRGMRSDERTKRIPVVVLTTSDEEKDIVRGYDLGVNSYIRKPVDFDAFVDTVRQLGLYWLVTNTAPPK
jgi:two-component system response regulator